MMLGNLATLRLRAKGSHAKAPRRKVKCWAKRSLRLCLTDLLASLSLEETPKNNNLGGPIDSFSRRHWRPID